MIKVLYFAWVRERIGVPYEMLETQSGTVMELVEELKKKESDEPNFIEEINKLNDLHLKGVISKEEFEKAKKKILG